MKIKSSIFDSFFVTRPILLIPVWAFSLFGYFETNSISKDYFINFWKPDSITVFFWITVFSLSVGTVYVLNQFADLDVDIKNGGTPLLATGMVSKRSAIIGALSFLLLSILIPIIFKKPSLSLFAISSLFLGLVYSFKPFYFSGRPFLDFISNGIGYGIIAYGVGWHLAGKALFTYHFLISAVPYFLLMCSGSINSTLPDYDGDKVEKKITTAVFLGIKLAHVVSMTLLLSSAAIAFFTKNWIPFICATISTPIFILYSLKPKQSTMEATYKVGGSICILLASFTTPLLFPISIVLFLATKLYFRFRFNRNYPSLVPNK